MMIKIQMLVLSAVFSLLAMPLLAYADNKQDPLQRYRDEIKRMEANASQTVLDQLKANESSSASNTMPSQAAPTPLPQSPVSNSARAFSPPTSATQNGAMPTNKQPNTNDNNPWLKPNPWEAQAHVNPWANAPIPSAGSTTPANSFTPPPAPPNIFAPPQPAVSTPNKTTNNNTNH